MPTRTWSGIQLGVLRVMGHGAVVTATNGRLEIGIWERTPHGEFDGRRRDPVPVKSIGE